MLELPKGVWTVVVLDVLKLVGTMVVLFLLEPTKVLGAVVVMEVLDSILFEVVVLIGTAEVFEALDPVCV